MAQMPTDAGASSATSAPSVVCRRRRHAHIAAFPGEQVARRRNKSEERDVAQARIGRLLALGRAELLGARAELADRYAALGLRVAQKYQTGLTRAQKAQLCRKCGAFRSAATSRTRLRG